MRWFFIFCSSRVGLVVSRLVGFRDVGGFLDLFLNFLIRLSVVLW